MNLSTEVIKAIWYNNYRGGSRPSRTIKNYTLEDEMSKNVKVKFNGGLEKWYKSQVADKFPSIKTLTCSACSGELARVDRDNFKCTNSECSAVAYLEIAEKE